MKLPGKIEQLLHPEKKSQEIFLSVFLCHAGVGTMAWHLDEKGQFHSLAHSFESAKADTWEARTMAADAALSEVEETLPQEVVLDKTVLGLSGEYLTEAGDIQESIRHKLRTFAKSLDISLVGFVSLHQAIVYKLKKEDGVPPSLILLSRIQDGGYGVYIYKIGVLTGFARIQREGLIAHNLEKALKQFPDVEIFPSRILLVADTQEVLETDRAALLSHPWNSKASFLHFPKIESISMQDVLLAISLSGAGELASGMGGEDKAQEQVKEEEKKNAVRQKVHKLEPDEESKDTNDETVEESVIQEKDGEEEGKRDDLTEESNVQLVSPTEFGFQKQDVLEAAAKMEDKKHESVLSRASRWVHGISAGAVFAKLPNVALLTVRLGGSKTGLLGLGAVTLVLLVLFFGVWFLPKASVTVFVLPVSVNMQAVVSVQPTATIADSATKVIPGRSQEKTISGEKTINTTGTKEIGDPARGEVTLYNKNTTSRTFAKGSVLQSAGLRFTLDADVSVASASESIGSLTFGKANAAITAVDIGAKGNLAANTEFTFRDIASSIATARNDQPLTGGTSRTVTVVSRKDRDTIVVSLTEELVEKAKKELVEQVAGSERLIAETIKTEVLEQSFAQEVDQESNQLSAKLAIRVTGISYNEADLIQILSAASTDKIPPGHELLSPKSSVRVSSVKSQKDGTITMNATLDGIALPSLSPDTIVAGIRGKSLSAAQEYLKGITGVGGAEFVFRWNLIRGKRLPYRGQNISVTVALNE